MSGLLITLFGGYFLIEAAGLPARARMFPVAVLSGILIVGLLLIVDAIRQWRVSVAAGPVEAPKVDASDARLAQALVLQVAVPGVVLVGAFLVLMIAGFYVASPVLLFVLYVFHIARAEPGALTLRRSGIGVVFAIVTTAFMYVVFTLLLGLPAPAGLLF